jgi:hypothetical protein
VRDRQRKARQYRLACERAKLRSAGLLPLQPVKRTEPIKATAEQLAFRDYIAMGLTAEEARARIAQDKSGSTPM